MKLDPVTAASTPLTLTVTGEASVTPPDTVMAASLVVSPADGAVIVTVGALASTVKAAVAVAGFPAASLTCALEGVVAVREGESSPAG